MYMFGNHLIFMLFQILCNENSYHGLVGEKNLNFEHYVLNLIF